MDATQETRRHPDIFTAEEAVEYLGLDGLNTLETLREKGVLHGWKPGKRYIYHRAELDAAISGGFPNVFQEQKPKRDKVTGPSLKIG